MAHVTLIVAQTASAPAIESESCAQHHISSCDQCPADVGETDGTVQRELATSAHNAWLGI